MKQRIFLSLMNHDVLRLPCHSNIERLCLQSFVRLAHHNG